MIGMDDDILFGKIQKVISFYKAALPLCDGRSFNAQMQYHTACSINERANVKIIKEENVEEILISANAYSFEDAVDKIIKMLPIPKEFNAAK